MSAGNGEQLKAQHTVRVHWIATQRRGLPKERCKGASLQLLTLASEGAARGLMHRSGLASTGLQTMNSGHSCVLLFDLPQGPYIPYPG
ncbi:hypothetical protein NDU88_002361 [Pleurodeles waltl]|uniref:Uncharacterized protein n=1 Tax=Pleurodeles waltl TaxID=8319 RepID=A0AAV7VDL3_PLEWA|nr:hypothetical protein NDU88_002361 [Pleurodeles waltl]